MIGVAAITLSSIVSNLPELLPQKEKWNLWNT
jgi:hypothetical protein